MKRTKLWIGVFVLGAVALGALHLRAGRDLEPIILLADRLGSATSVPIDAWRMYSERLDRRPPEIRNSFSSAEEIDRLRSCSGEKVQITPMVGRRYSDGKAAGIHFWDSVCVRFPLKGSRIYTVRAHIFRPHVFAAGREGFLNLLVHELLPGARHFGKNLKDLASATVTNTWLFRMTPLGAQEMEATFRADAKSNEALVMFYAPFGGWTDLVLDDVELFSPGPSASFERYGFDSYSESTVRERLFRKVWKDDAQDLSVGIFSPPGKGTFTFPLTLPEKAFLSFGVSPVDISPEGPGQSQVRIRIRSGDGETKIYERRVGFEMANETTQIDLASYGGRKVFLSLDSESPDDGPPTFWRTPRISSKDVSGGDEHQNVLLITIDALRPDHVGAYGYPRPTTPIIDRVAASGALFRQAYATHPTTFQSIASIMTSRLLFMTPDHPFPTKFLPSMETIWEAFRRAGFEVAFFGNMEFVGNLRKGLETVYVGNAANADEREADRLIAWFSSQKARPFFAWIHLVGPHILGPVGKKSMDQFPKAHEIDQDRLVGGRGERCAPYCLDADRKQALVDFYDAKTRTADNLLGKILNQLDQRGLADRTAVVITSDHGENLMDAPFPDWMEHGLLSPSVLRVPLIVLDPNHPGKREIDDLVSHIDLAPTLLDLGGVEPSFSFEGSSVLPLARGEEGVGRRFVQFQGGCDDTKGPMGIFDGRYAFLWNPHRCKLAYPRGVFIRPDGEVYDWWDPGWYQRDLSSKEPELLLAFQKTGGIFRENERLKPNQGLTAESGLDLLEQAGYLSPAKKPVAPK